MTNAEDPATQLTKREWFAGMIVQGILASGKTPLFNGQECAHDVITIRLTDAIIAALNKEPKP